MMKAVSVLAFAAAASASWNDATGYSCPGNTDNSCNTQQSSGGFGGSWGDLSVGSSVSSYGGLYFGNTECMSAGSFSKRALGGRFAPRTSEKAIGGSCGHESSSSVQIGCGSSSSSSSSSSSGSSSSGSWGGSSSGSSSSGGSDDEDISSFSLDSFSIYTEFSCDLEFQYTMSDGSTCKQRSSCSSEGSTVKNTQCGGATNLTIVYPTGQTGSAIPTASSTCSVNIPTMSFACGSASSTVIASTQSYGGHKTTSTAVGQTVTPSSPASETKPTPTNVGGGSTLISQSTAFSTSYSVGTTIESSIVETPTPSVGTTTESSVIESPTPSTIESSVVESPTPSVESSTTSNSPVTQSAPSSVESTDYSTSTQVTTYIGTSTIYSTSYQTITSCGPEVTNCPISEGETATTTVVVAVSTTICPVTETQTAVYSSGATTPIASTPIASTPIASSSSPEQSTSSNSPVQGGSPSGSSPAVVGSTTTVSTASAATQTISYPTVLPACISTWTYITGCVDNSDTSCYCPDATFVQNVYDCLYAYGESDQDVADAVQYFQGLCGGYAEGNPAVATGATVTSYLTVTASSIESVSATTIVVTATTVVPCTDSNGSTIPSSSTTIVSPVSMTVPQVALTTQTVGSTTSVGVVPVASYTQVSAVSSNAAATGASPPYYTGSAAGSQPSGVAGASGAGATTTASATGAIVTAGASKAQVGAGFGAAALAAFALAL